MRTFLKELFCWKYVHIQKKSWKCLMRHKLETFLRKKTLFNDWRVFQQNVKKEIQLFWNVLCTHRNPCTQGTCSFYENCKFIRSVQNFTSFAKKLIPIFPFCKNDTLPFSMYLLKYLNHKCQKRSSKPFFISFSSSLICLLFAYL